MTKRIKQHQLEDISRHKFALSLPQKWVFRDKDKDYGIDGEVEVFDSNGRATGLVFWVQLKSTGSEKKRTIRGVNLSLETIKYYKRLEIPVLIVRYSEHEDRLYVKWARGIDLFYAKIDAKTMRVHFSESDIFDEGKTAEIKKYLAKLRAATSGAIKLPINLNLSFASNSICGVSSNILLYEIRRKVNNFGSILSLDPDPNSLSVDVVIDRSTLKVGFLDITGCTLHSVDLMEPSTLAEDLLKDISLALSVSLSNLQYSDLAARIVFTNGLQERLKIKYEMLEQLLPCLLKSNFFKESLEMISDSCDGPDENYLEIITNASLLFIRGNADEGKQEEIEKFLKKSIERCKKISTNLYGVSQYNLGNFYRSSGRYAQAARCMLVARRYEAIYYEQEYFYRELAGVLFEMGKYSFSSRLYKKAIDIDRQEDTLALYADSLMFSGKYKEAHDVFECYITETKSSQAEWHLKLICLSYLIEEREAKSQYRNIKKAVELADVANIEDPEVEKSLEKALEQDLLCGLAWFNLAYLKKRSGKIEDAVLSYTMCALVESCNIEAWVYATAYSFNKTVAPQISVLLVRAGYFCCGDHYIEALYKTIKGNFGEEVLSQIAPVIERLLTEDRKAKNDKIEIRMINKEGNVKNILAERDLPTTRK